MMINWKYIIAAAVTLASCAAVWWRFRPQPAPVSVPVIAQPAKAVATVGKETIQAKVKVYKQEAKKRLNLPQNITSDPAKHVAASSTINTPWRAGCSRKIARRSKRWPRP